MAMAQEMFNAGRYQAVIDSFPQSPLAAVAKDRMADSLYNAGQYDLLMQKFPTSTKAVQVKEQKATEELTKVKKMKGTAKRQALESFMQTYSGTAAYKEAGEMLSKIREAEQKKAAKK
jgi:hypothetical protein